MGQWEKCQGVSRRDGPQADRGNLQCGRGGTVSLEGFRAKRSRDPPVGAGWNRQWNPALVHEIRRRLTRSPLAQDRGRPLYLALSQRTILAERGIPGPCRIGLFPTNCPL